MTSAIGVVMTEHIVAGRLENHRLSGEPVRYPGNLEEVDALTVMPSGELMDLLANQITELASRDEKPVEAIGVAVPGVVRHGVVEDAPNLTQIKGMRMADELGRIMLARGIKAPVHIANDADAIAAGVAAKFGQLDRLTRVWNATGASPMGTSGRGNQNSL